MSEQQAPQREKAPPSAGSSGSTLSRRHLGELASRLGEGRRPIIIVLLIYAVLLIVLNTRRVSISLVFFTIHTELLVLIAVSGLIGFACGYLVRRRKSNEQQDG
ncbi:MAG TPA: hypothetical protein VGG41_03100 [Solirubrobacteraceae bacterium]|jgi:hypothetical protein